MAPNIPLIDSEFDEQLDFDTIWANNLRDKYGIRNAVD